jgi:hypothetical protein
MGEKAGGRDASTRREGQQQLPFSNRYREKSTKVVCPGVTESVRSWVTSRPP